MAFEVYEIPQGKIIIAFSDKNLSVGTLHLNPGKELQKHNRPILESLFQIKGSCVMKLFNSDDSINEVLLEEGQTLDIEPNKFHIHSNPGIKTSITFWKANGDITRIIENIRKNRKM